MTILVPIPIQGFYFSNVEHQILHYVCNHSRINIYPINGDRGIVIYHKTLTRFELNRKSSHFYGLLQILESIAFIEQSILSVF